MQAGRTITQRVSKKKHLTPSVPSIPDRLTNFKARNTFFTYLLPDMCFSYVYYESLGNKTVACLKSLMKSYNFNAMYAVLPECIRHRHFQSKYLLVATRKHGFSLTYHLSCAIRKKHILVGDKRKHKGKRGGQT